MEDKEASGESQIVQPARPLPKKYHEPILYLADRMSESDKNVAVKERSVIEDLAAAVNKGNFRAEKWYREMTEENACGLLDIEAAKRGALVVLALVLKSDQNRLDSEHDFFRKIREMLRTAPVTVPVDLEAHRALAFKYLAG
jgi:hypothetical protein